MSCSRSPYRRPDLASSTSVCLGLTDHAPEQPLKSSSGAALVRLVHAEPEPPVRVSGEAGEMALSERDRRVLAEMERELIAAEPTAATFDRVRGFRRGLAIVRTIGPLLGILGGFCYVLLGVIDAGVLGVIGAVIGFAIIVVSCACVISAYQSRRSVHLAGGGYGTAAC